MRVTPETLPQLGEMLYNRRQKKGLTQKKVAIKAGISHVTVCRLELGEIESPRIADIAGVCEALGLEVVIRERRR